jgi:dolichol-phosphate mannosyltransferase
MGISVVLLAVNEAKNLKVLLPKIIANLQKTETEYEILLIDSAFATDETPEICALYSKVRYINQEEPRYAGAFRTGIRYAVFDRILVLDADGSHEPDMIPALYKKSIEGYDLVIGSRYCKGGKSNDSTLSFLMSQLLNFIMRIVIGVRARDISTSYRVYRTDLLKPIRTTSVNYEILQEVILRMKKLKKPFSIAEVPIVFEKRMYGKSKRKLFAFILTYIKTLFRFIHIRMSKA